MKRNILLIVAFIWFGLGLSFSQDINYVKRFANENHPEIGYWFISPDLLKDNRYLEELDSIIHQCPYTLVFLTARDGADFYDFKTMYPVFKMIVETAHRSGLKIGLQLWGNYKDKTIDGSQRMIAEDEVQLDESGKASYTAQARFVRFPDRLLKTDLFRVYAFKKTADGFYDPATLKDITSKCTKNLPDKKTVEITINGGAAVKGLTACIMTQEYCSQSSMWGDVEINGFVDAMQHYKDISFNGFALDEYGNKFVERPNEGGPDFIFRGQWYSTSMAAAFKNSKGKSLDKVLFDSRYAPQDKPEIRMKAINEYMEFMRGGALRVENAVYKKAKEIFGQNIFIGIHDTYHNHLTNDEIWANGISWWKDPPGYGQTDEKTPLPIQMGIAMAHTKNAMYNQYYDKIFPPVQEKALFDLRYGVRTHYHAMHDKRPNRFDLLMPDAIDGINKVERGARLLNKFNPSLPEVKLLVVFGMEALQNWYPNNAERGMYDINDKLGIEEKAVEIWNAGYLNALIPSDLIADGQLKIGSDGKPVINGHQFDAVVYLYPQYAKESELKFLEDYEKKGGKLMIEGKADHDFNANDISKRFRLIYDKATVKGCSVDDLSKLGISKNLLRDGCKNADGSYVFTNLNSIKTDAVASFSVNIDGDTYTGQYKGLAVIGAEKKGVLKKFGASGFKELTQNGKVLLRFDEPVDIFISKQGVKYIITLADASKKIKPEINKL